MGWQDAPAVQANQPAWASAPTVNTQPTSFPSQPAQQPSFAQTVVASPIGRGIHDVLMAPFGALSNVADQVNEVRAENKASSINFGAPENYYQAALAAQRNRPGYADAREQQDALAKIGEYGLMDEFTAPFNSSVAGVGGLTTAALDMLTGKPGNFLNSMNAASDAQTASQRAYQGQNPLASTAAQIAGGLLLAPSGMPQTLSREIGTMRNPIDMPLPPPGALTKAEIALKNKAAARVKTRLQEDGLSPDEVFFAQQAAKATGDNLTLMDLGGKNVRGLAGAVYRAPGAAGRTLDTFLEGRVNSAGPALTSDVQAGVAKGSTYQTTQDLLEARSRGARPAYEEVEKVGPVHSERLQTFLDQPEVQEGIRRGLKLERLNAVAEGRPFVDADYGIVGYKDGNWDMPIFSKVPTVKTLIVANEGLGAKIAEMVDPTTRRLTKDGLALKNFRDAYQSEVDRLTGGKYAAARNQWSGPSQSMEAVRDGREHFTRTESNEQIAAEFDKLSDSDKDFYRLGAAEAKIDALERAPDASDKTKRIINSERDRKRFRILFGSDAAAENFIASVARKRAAFDTKQLIKGGSQTAGRVADDMSENIPFGLDVAHGVGQAASGNWLGAAHAAYRLKRDLGLRNNPALNSEIASILINPNLGDGAALSALPLPPSSAALGRPQITSASQIPFGVLPPLLMQTAPRGQ